jgi:pheromone shutdown protein TraB
VVAVVGAGHVAGIRKAIEDDVPTDMQTITHVPPASSAWKWLGWGIPAVIIGSIAFIALTQGSAAAGDNIMFWTLANALPSGLGAVLALAHPWTILAAMVAAPITSLTPVIGAGYVTAFVQAYVRPPRVRDFHTVAEDAGTASRWWSNRLLKVLLAFIFPALGSMIGSFAGITEIVSNLF